ncbi:AraC family transcriptional regulator [Lysinibacillus endophyticus]|uniref:AraC family transcriptional regulator n=1 Tax=Ureibacillus endophyticus TaxID=1978490 RepID=UPI0031370B7C
MIQQFNHLMDYIESHLTEDISGEEISKIVGLSDYHFRRMFSYLAGMPLNEYIKNRRLSSANEELINGAKVTDVAYKYRYQSVEGFSRAFRDWSGYLPSEVVKNKIQKSFPKFSFFIDIRGGKSMEFKIERKEKFNIVGVSKRVPIQFEGVNNAIVELAQSITEQQRKEMHDLADLYPHHVLNVSYNFDEEYLEEKGNLTHMIGFATTKENPYEDLEQITVDESLWAIFPNEGPFPKTLQDTMARIYSEWLPSSDYELVNLPGISFSKHNGQFENVYSEVWVAVKKKD